MSASSSRHAPPLPRKTSLPVPVDPLVVPRSSRHRSPPVQARDTSIVDQQAIAAAENECLIESANNVFTCYPTNDTTVAQHEWTTIVWNSNLPQFTQTNLVNLYVFHADSGASVVNFTNVVNPSGQAGSKHVQVDDLWFGERGLAWSGSNLSFPFYWLITRSDRNISNTDIPQSTFTAVQTTLLDSVVASMSSASAASASSASASRASASSAAAASASPTGTMTSSSTQGPNGTGASIQRNGGGSSFPKWAIAVIVVLGFLALVASVMLAFFIMRRLRQRREASLSQRNSMGSSTPMMANVDRGGPQSPVLEAGALGAAAGAAAGVARRPSSPTEHHDTASMISRTSAQGLFSDADAAIMANAFRQALRKPDFADRPVIEGESPDDQHGASRAELINQELAEEGRDIRSVSSSRGVRVETLSDDGNDTATVHH